MVKKERILNVKILILMFIAFIFTFTQFNVSADTLESGSFNPNWNTNIYNTEWSKGNVSYWMHKYKTFLLWGDRTDVFLRITNDKGDLLNLDDVTRIESTYIIDNKEYHTIREKNEGLLSIGSTYLTLNPYSKEGWFTSIDNYHYTYNSAQVEIKRIFDNDIEECNFFWRWNYNVDELVCLYIWYLNEDGNEVASSFFPNGEHPLYDENGYLLGIYDYEGNLLSNTTLNNNGMIIEIDPITNKEKELLTFDDQLMGIVEGNSLDYFNFTNLINDIRPSLMLLALILLFIAIVSFIAKLKLVFGYKIRYKKRR